VGVIVPGKILYQKGYFFIQEQVRQGCKGMGYMKYISMN
jgi:hypothetical protein